MIELTSAYKHTIGSKFLVNPSHIIYVAKTEMQSVNYETANTVIEYFGLPDIQVAYVQETYEEIKELLK